MSEVLAESLDALAAWRRELDQGAASFARFLAEHELAGDGAESAAADEGVLAALRERLASDRVVLAFVAEFSRGKSELVNAIFFGDAGRRVLPATPGRTTMCPVELFHDATQPPALSLLPIETRLAGLSLAELRGRPEAWQQVPLDPSDAEGLARALGAVTRTQRVDLEQARRLGLWSDEHPEDNPAPDADGQVEVPAWRHALINHPHPLLSRGLVVLDTPGLNAIGAEPELTLSLLPAAHATVFVLAADTGVTKSDLAIWREHLGGDAQAALERFVVLNKIDTLADPLATPEQVAAQIERQCAETAATLGLPAARVFPLAARDALAARVGGNAAALAASRLPAFEAALAAELLPRQRQLLVQAAAGTVQQMRQAAGRRLADRRRQQAEQLLELRGLRGKSGAKLRALGERLEAEQAEFEGCTARIAALRAVQARQLRGVLGRLSSDDLRREVAVMQSSIGFGPLQLGAKAAFETLFERLGQRLVQAAAQADELRQMLDASFLQLNAEHGFAFALSVPPALEPFQAELGRIADTYRQYLGLSQAWRMAMPGYAEQFRRVLLGKLRVLFERAAGEIEMWSKAAMGQVDTQLRERRNAFRRRREAIDRVASATGELDARLAELEAADARLVELQAELDRRAAALLALAEPPAVREAALRLDAA